MRSKILNLPSSSTTAVHRSVLGKGKNKNDEKKEGRVAMDRLPQDSIGVAKPSLAGEVKKSKL